MKTECCADRDLSWLKYNGRVLGKAADRSVPLCERIFYFMMYQNSCDSFYMERVGVLYEQLMKMNYFNEYEIYVSGKEQINAILQEDTDLSKVKDLVYKDIMVALKEQEVEIVRFKELTLEETQIMDLYFDEKIRPFLSPFVIGKQQPFPFLHNQQTYVLAGLKTSKGNQKIAVIPCFTPELHRMIKIPGSSNRYLLLEDYILNYITQIFIHYKVECKSIMRILHSSGKNENRNRYEEETEWKNDNNDKIEIYQKGIRHFPVKLELGGQINYNVMASLCKYLNITKQQIFYYNSPLDLAFFKTIRDLLKENKELYFEKKIPQLPEDIDLNQVMLPQIREKDRILALPYDSMKPWLQLLREAASDENVLSIKAIVHHPAKYSRVLETLEEAAENGREVVVLAAYPETCDGEDEIDWGPSKRLEDAGCKIAFGLRELKVNANVCVIKRKWEGQIEYITQVGTGNYNDCTENQDTDFCLITTSNRIGMEAASIFHLLATGNLVEKSKYFLVAPGNLRNRIIAMIEEETEAAKNSEEAYIGIKVNALTDTPIMNKLIEASKAGVKVDLLISKICSLIPGIRNQTENIRVKTILGRYPEHSILYIFGKGCREKVYISSADLTTDSLYSQLDMAVPVYNEEAKSRIAGMFQVMLKDNVNGKFMTSDGRYDGEDKRFKAI